MSAKPALQIQFTFKTLFVFLFFFFLMHEMHEQAHIITGKLICGGWGERDFNVWGLCEGCLQQHPIAIIATFTGPLFTFLMLWLGWYWLKYGRSAQSQSVGLVFILGNMPFGRMFMAATGSGDEVWGLRTLLINPQHSNFQQIRLLGFVIVSAICLPPLIAAYKAIGNKNRLLVFTGFLIVPLILDTIIILIALNGLLQKGVLNTVAFAGIPLLIILWLVLCAVIVLTNFKRLTQFAVNKKL